MHRIFTIREILDEILSKVKPPSHLVATACVNRTWFFSSLPGLWKDVTLTKALKLLGDVSEGLPDDECPFVEIEPPSLAQWDRFFTYSKYVRILTGCEYDIYTLAAAASFRPDDLQYLFPNLRSLTWELQDGKYLIERFPMADITALISPKLEIFILDLRELQLPFFWYLCSTLITRVQTLRCLKLCLTSREEEANGCLDPFMQVLRSFRKTLRHVWMPESFHTKETMDELGKFPNLFELGIGIPIKMMYDELWNRYPEIYKEGERDFYALSNLSFTGPQHSLFDGFLNKGKFLSLTDITWTACMEIVDPEFFVTTIVEACPELYSLWVGDQDAYEDEDDLSPIIPWEIIRIILRCPGLAVLSLHCCRVSMDPEDWIELLSRGEIWEMIHIYSVTPLLITDLPVFMRCCPGLSDLGIYVDVRTIDGDIPVGTPLPPSIISPNITQALTQRKSMTFSLRHLNFGYSPYYPHLGPKIASFIMEMCISSNVEQPLVTGWNWPWDEFKTHMSNVNKIIDQFQQKI